MAQVTIFGLKESLAKNKAALSEIIHDALVNELGLPPDKKFQRIIPMGQTPKHCWGIRGRTGDELSLGYRIDV